MPKLPWESNLSAPISWKLLVMLVVIAVGKSDLLHLHWHFHIHALPTACVCGNYGGMMHYVNTGFDVGIVCCTQDSVTSRCNCRNVKTFETCPDLSSIVHGRSIIWFQKLFDSRSWVAEVWLGPQQQCNFHHCCKQKTTPKENDHALENYRENYNTNEHQHQSKSALLAVNCWCPYFAWEYICVMDGVSFVTVNAYLLLYNQGV